jgi:hypothetical protein
MQMGLEGSSLTGTSKERAQLVALMAQEAISVMLVGLHMKPKNCKILFPK